jgi:hypothetical protein
MVKKMRLRKKTLLKLAAAGVTLFGSYLLLLCFPQALFHSSVQADNLTLYSDKPFSPESARHILELVGAKLSASPLYSPKQNHVVYICNARWRQRLFFNRNYGVGGVNQYPLTTNVFLRNAVIEDNCLIGPRGGRVPADRPLDYFIAHEITHTLTARAAGWISYYQLPQWVREGYADYVGKGTSFNYDEARLAFLSGAPEMDWEKTGLYWRYHLLVAHLLDRKHWTVQRLLEDPPAQEAVEDAIRAEVP